jgi:Acyltransferase family
MASLLVVTAHVTRCLAPWVLSPAMTKDGGVAFIQLPMLRAFTVGRPSVAAFALVAGFVNSLKPIRQTRASAAQIDVTLSGIAKAAYRRTGRFILPAMFATTIAWLLCQMNAYHISAFCDSQWMRDTSPYPSPGFFRAIRDLVANLITTWTSGQNDYDKVQWTLTFLLSGSMRVYLTLFATAHIEPNYRYLVYMLLYFYYYCMGDGKSTQLRGYGPY